MKNRFSYLLVLLGALALCSVPAHGASLEGQHFDDGARLGDADLQLNGVGLRGVFIIKAYVAGLYLTRKATTLQEVLAAPGPKRLQMRMLLGATPQDFNTALVAGIRKNASPAEMQALQERISQMERAIEGFGNTSKGDVVNLDYQPQQGMTLVVNGTVRGGPIPGADFYAAVLGIFVGDNPIDKRLRKGLLGQ